jgi:probable rRNA maturation factor
MEICLSWILERFCPGKNLEVNFISAKKMKALNKKWHGSDCVTDVLAFPYEGDLLGEIFICPEKALSEVAHRSVTLTSELVLYAVHGALHLVGFDDRNPQNAEKMHRMEMEVLARAGLCSDRMEMGA